MTPYYSDESVTLWHGDCLEVMRELPSGSVDCAVTSPPYFGLRDYGVDGQLGAEASPVEYVENLRALFAEVRRVLADDGTLWLNLGDSYAHTNPSGPQGASGDRSGRGFTATGAGGLADLPDKNLLGIPWRVAFALQDAGWILRAEVIWDKRNGKPEAVKDRPTRAHETVFLLSKQGTYWYDADAIREEHTTERHPRPGGRNARSVWSISTQPFPGAHFATMPPALAERCIRAGCRPGGVVLDPFSGAGTTGMAAARHGRRYVGIDINADYLNLSLHTRLSQPTLDLGNIT